jgi:molybdopterin-containing oxidoreductase family iron-sulfur binding subunit
LDGEDGSADAYDAALQNGVIEPATMPAGAGTFNGSTVASAAGKLASAKASGKNELVIYQKIGIGTGYQANNPWLQELPDPCV